MYSTISLEPVRGIGFRYASVLQNQYKFQNHVDRGVTKLVLDSKYELVYFPLREQSWRSRAGLSELAAAKLKN